MPFINTEEHIKEYETVKDSYESLYDYSLYVCGGDFNSFDDIELLRLSILQD
jgi:hypothetical protein